MLIEVYLQIPKTCERFEPQVVQRHHIGFGYIQSFTYIRHNRGSVQSTGVHRWRLGKTENMSSCNITD